LQNDRVDEYKQVFSGRRHFDSHDATMDIDLSSREPYAASRSVMSQISLRNSRSIERTGSATMSGYCRIGRGMAFSPSAKKHRRYTIVGGDATMSITFWME